jgi:hypothetical protein
MARRNPFLRRFLLVVCALIVTLGGASRASASATLLLEEPYGKFGFFTATGHAAVYLSNVCADTPTVLRRCNPGETGVVLSRYYDVAGYDWLAIPLIPYLYAVERPEDVPLFADAKMVAFLRDTYRRKYLEAIVPDTADGDPPSGNWAQLVGSSYDRTIYGFEIATTPERDDELIRWLNGSPDASHFRLITHNCADFAKVILNFYYPKALHRSIVADVGITTPKQMAKALVKFEARNPELESSRFVIAQVPGSLPRSAAVHGVVESFLKSKKYIVPSAIASPIFAGCVFAVYVGTGTGRFDPERDALVFNPDASPEPPLSKQDRKMYGRQLSSLLAEWNAAGQEPNAARQWEKMRSKATIGLDSSGEPVLQMALAGSIVLVGVSTGNVAEDTNAPLVARQILAARLESELRHSPARGLSPSAVARDWTLLQQAQRNVQGDRPQLSVAALSTAAPGQFSSGP